MELDVEGRTLRGDRGKSRCAFNPNRGALQFSQHGLAPENQHRGAGGNHVGRKTNPVVQSSSATRQRVGGKKPVKPEECVIQTEQEKLAERIGVRLNRNATRRLQARSGAENDVVVSSKGLVGMRTLTAEAVAARDLQKAVQGAPQLSPKYQDAMRMGGEALLKAHKQMLREQKHDEFERQRSANASANASRSASRDGSRATSPNRPTPFALDFPTATNGTHAEAKHSRKKCGQQPVATTDRMAPSRKVFPQGKGDVPFDNKDCSQYPDPPPIGVSDGKFSRNPRRHAVDRPQTADQDTLAAMRAQAKAAVSHNRPRTPDQDVIFGQPAPDPPKSVARSPRRNETAGLAMTMNGFNPFPQDVKNRAPVAAGRSHSPNSYVKTALW